MNPTDWQAAELHRAQRLLARGGAIDEVLESLAHGLTAKLLYGAMSELRSADDEHRGGVAEAMTRPVLRSPLRNSAGPHRMARLRRPLVQPTLGG
jgi:glutamyl-tRNA reductase